MVNEFKALLEKFVKNECKINEVVEHLRQLLKKHPQLAQPIQTQIDALVEKKYIKSSDADAIRRVTSEYITESAAEQTIISMGDDDRTAVLQDDDKTVINTDNQSAAAQDKKPTAGAADEDSTQKTAIEDDDSTLVNVDLPTNLQTKVEADDDFGLDLDTSATENEGDMPTMTHGSEVIGVGSVLRNRFELVSKLGEGGMGAVFMAVDKIKEEAQDKHPKVAVKVLNETFKQFRESFIALQRESSKQQRLAHPNIATVFDFDRDYTYGTVFMTMEMLEGEPLDKFIQRLPKGGLSYEEARPMIEGMCNGLAYAHHHDLVHSDFKPANTFLNKDGVVKLLDFGIARAAKPKIDDQGKKEATLFDPGTLGALTPAYASTEMLEGETPVPSDDIYALACVTYQLLSGQHPFKKMPANQARDNNLSPAPIKKLNRRQNKALMKGLALERSKRTQSVEEFLEYITPKKPIVAYALAATFVMLAIIGVLARDVIDNYLRNERNKETIATIINAGDNNQSDVVTENLDVLQGYDEESQGLIKADPNVQRAIVGHFINRIEEKIDKEKDQYDYPGAANIMSEARTFYPDSGALDAKQADMDNRKTAELEDQRDLYTRFLKIGPWLTTEGKANDIPDIVATIKAIDPRHDMLSDPRLVGSYIKEIQAAREERNFDRADSLISQADQFIVQRTALINEADELSRAKYLAAEQRLLSDLLGKISATGVAKDVSKAITVNKELAHIRLLSPENKQLQAISAKIANDLLKKINASKNQTSLTQVATQFQLLAAAMTVDKQNSVRAALDGAWQKAGGVDPVMAQKTQQMSKDIEKKITDESGKNDFSYEWTQTLRMLALELASLVGNEHASIQQIKRKLATQFMQQATATREAERLVQSSILIEHAKSFDASTPGLADAEKAVADALEKQELKRIDEERLATISALKQDTLAKAKSEKVDDALRFLDLLKVYLLPDDPFLITTGPEAIGEAYASIAIRAKNQADGIKKDYIGQRDAYVGALNQIKAGLEVAPKSKALTNARAVIQNALNIAEVRHAFDTSEKLDLSGLRKLLDRIKAFDAKTFTRLQTEFSEAVAQRISTMESYDPQAAKIFLDSAKKLPINQVLLSRIRITVPETSKYAKQITEAIKVSKLTEANNVLKQAITEESDHPEIKRLRGVLADKIQAANKAYKQYQASLRDNDADNAKKLLSKALKIWRDNNEFQSSWKSINIGIIASKAVCQNRLAGYGRRSKGRCYDMISNTVKGPIMVVLPAGAGRSNPFAISKFEISVHDFNQFCQQTKTCSTNQSNVKLPITGISFQQAQEYTQWLSKISGAKYRLPSEAEWVYAATADGKQPKGKSYNCTLRLGDVLMKGSGLEDTDSGRQNGWGLINYLGNAQEWVEGPAGLKARGGAYKDSMQACTIDLERIHDGNPDEITTFRVVRDIT